MLYAVYSLLPCSEAWRIAAETGNLSPQLNPLYIAAGVGLLLVVLIGGGVLALRLVRTRAAAKLWRATPVLVWLPGAGRQAPPGVST